MTIKKWTEFYSVAVVLTLLVLWTTPAPAKGVEEPWSEIEARTKFLRTKHYIEMVRVHSDVFRSASAKGGKEVPGPFPVHVILPDDYEQNVDRRYGVVYLLGGKSGWDNGPELGGATYWSVWCKVPLTMDNLKSGNLTPESFQQNVNNEELQTFNRWLREDPYEEVIVVSLWNPAGGNTARYEQYLIDEVIPFIDAHYRTVPDRRFRAIDGACAGAAQAIMISARRPEIFAYAGGQQTDLGSYPMTGDVWRSNLGKIMKAGGIAYNINTNVRDGCNSYSNGGRLYQLVSDMRAAGLPVEVNVFQSCGHGYCAYRYPNGHQALYWFGKQFKRNSLALGINKDLPGRRVASTPSQTGKQDGLQEQVTPTAQQRQSPLPGLW
ncbi:MAG TPA: alpha/beta hydrolase-fold protein [Desulfomonilaceae bacterium]|nr:alpha/beta hydrolase-fold protein [Desulfomonilaceae bacterium]